MAAGIFYFVACFTFHVRFTLSSENPGSWALIAGYALGTLGSILMLLAFLGIDSKLLPGWVIYLGRISFGLYIFHDFALYTVEQFPLSPLMADSMKHHLLELCLRVGLKVGLPLVLTFLMAAISYRYLETPFLQMKKRHAAIVSGPTPE
jgi:peptidoglycan/LPS O-acetylase OafA/YrhL